MKFKSGRLKLSFICMYTKCDHVRKKVLDIAEVLGNISLQKKKIE